MSVLDFIEEEEGYELFYERFMEVKHVRNSEAQAHCPKHTDRKPSFNFNVDTGKWFCQSCAKGGHTPIDFYAWVYDCDYHDAEDELEVLLGLKRSPSENYKAYHRNLLKDKLALQHWIKRGVTIETLKKHLIGWDGKRYHYPVFDFGGNHRNTLKHHPNPKPSDNKSISSFTGEGSVRLSPIRNTIPTGEDIDEIWVVAGWGDFLLADQHGLNAITITGAGEGVWHPNFNKYFEGKRVFICYDNDTTGRTGAKKVAREILNVTDEVYIVELPRDMPDHSDLTDYLNKYSIEEFLKLERKLVDDIEDTEDNVVVQQVHLSETTDAALYNKHIRTTAIITGKGDIYGIPSKIQLTCKNADPDTPACARCSLLRNKGKLITKIRPYDSRNIELINLRTNDQRAVIRRIAGVPQTCYKAKIEIKSMVNIEEVNLVPEVDYTTNKSKSYIARAAYIVNNDALDMNRPYIFDGVIMPHPINQKSTILINAAEATKDTIDAFEMTPVLKERLSIFQADTIEEMNAVLKMKMRDYEAVTMIYERRLLLMALDLIFHSVLSFTFRNKRINRAYLNLLVYGDTATGKSDATERLMEYFKIGDMTGGENASFAGLVGGVQQTVGSNKWGISWKLIPLNDRGLVKVDEFHDMDDKDKKKMSELMSKGIATIQKIAAGETMARTRLILIANAKNGNLNTYQFGCEAIPGIVGGSNEDVRRLDLVIGASADGMDLDELAEKQRTIKKVKRCEPDLCHALVMWAWSRKASDIIFTKEAEDTITKYTKLQAKKYHTSIPLVQGIEHSVKLARLSAACACQFFSTDDDAQKVIVKSIHVEMVYRFLEKVYSSYACKYDVYSEQKKMRDTLVGEEDLYTIGITKKIASLLLNVDKFNKTMIESIFGVDGEEAKLIIYKLLQSNAVEHYGTSLLRKTPAFIRFLSTGKFKEKVDPLY